MANELRFFRGLDATRITYTALSGEPIYCTDTKRMWIGDGSTPGGVPVTDIPGGNSTTLLGAIPYQSDTGVTSLLSPNTTTTKKFLYQTGNGTNGAVPAWEDVYGNAQNEVKMTGLVTTNSSAVAATDSVVVGVGKVQGQLSRNSLWQTSHVRVSVTGHCSLRNDILPQGGASWPAHTRSYIDAEDYREKANGVVAGLDI